METITPTPIPLYRNWKFSGRRINSLQDLHDSLLDPESEDLGCFSFPKLEQKIKVVQKMTKDIFIISICNMLFLFILIFILGLLFYNRPSN